MRYFLGFLIAIGLIVLVFVLVLKSFSSSGGGKSSNLPKPLISYASTDAVAELTIDGPVTANQTHQAVQINVSQSQTQINIMQGYEGQVINTQAYASNQNAYAVFLRAIDLQGFTKGNSDPADSDDRGVCPFGDRYVYELVNNGQTIQRYWSTSCGGGTSKGNVANMNSLFEAQIPDYDTLTADVAL